MDLSQMEKEVRALRDEVVELREQVGGLQRALEDRKHPVELLLWQRGAPVLSHGERTHVLLPLDATAHQTARFYRLMRRYSFRLFVRDVLQFPEGGSASTLVRYCSPKTVRTYLKHLHELGIVHVSSKGGYRLARQVVSFGPTLEWYVSEIFRREFLAPALFSVRLRNTQYGGDYDVVARLEGLLVYVEVKSSPPRGVELQAVSAFLKRLEDLQPQVAVFLVDTELRMKDKMVPLFREALDERGREPERWPVVRLVNELFHIRHGTYIVNSRKGIYTNLRTCFRDFFRRQECSKLPYASAEEDIEAF